ncbi:hypothetical protein [Olleya sp. HaHaR_3_96]|uniref:hypothetical protein n=1 Tax=Olleya sp. HaHaR_3_96 TaxID=2745560 RepID=UPI001C4EE097|nr:hypothetical protein [Olleya sp. HaHaR_3_96]QXP59388.1 hypothetical protein H0I26_15950 [Olleya sp. HaHaR_3_96]
MININHLNIDLEYARKMHADFFTCFITKKLTGKACVTSNSNNDHPNRPVFCKGYDDKSFKYQNQKDFLIKFLITQGNLNDLILGKPERLIDLNDAFKKSVDNLFNKVGVYEEYINTKKELKSKFKPNKVHCFFKDLASVLNYSILSNDKDYNSYTLTSNLGIRSCVYCNRTYTITQRKRKDVKDGRLMSPQLDHWFPQSKFPLLEISFHNLIPSCEICNSRVKSDKLFTLEDYFHPYQDENVSIDFGYRYSFMKKRYQFYFKNPSDAKILRTCKEMFIDQMYDGHSEELEDLITLRKEYSETYLDSLKSNFPDANLSDELIYLLAFGTELYEKDFHKRPLSKFKRDILIDLEVIKKETKISDTSS